MFYYLQAYNMYRIKPKLANGRTCLVTNTHCTENLVCSRTGLPVSYIFMCFDCNLAALCMLVACWWYGSTVHVWSSCRYMTLEPRLFHIYNLVWKPGICVRVFLEESYSKEFQCFTARKLMQGRNLAHEQSGSRVSDLSY